VDDRAKALAGINIFAGLGEPALEQLANIATEEAHKLGEFVFHEGSPGDGLYLILSGKVRISREVAGMGEEALAILKAGETFGEMSIIDGSPRSADARVQGGHGGSALPQQGSRVRDPLELGPDPVEPAARDERQDDVPLRVGEVLTP
jgi:hypothetical protein